MVVLISEEDAPEVPDFCGKVPELWKKLWENAECCEIQWLPLEGKLRAAVMRCFSAVCLPPHPPQCAHWGTFPSRGRLLGRIYASIFLVAYALFTTGSDCGFRNIKRGGAVTNGPSPCL